MTYPTHSQLSAVLGKINVGETSCYKIAEALNMTVDDVASCAMVLMESDLITCDDIEAPDMEDESCTL